MLTNETKSFDVVVIGGGLAGLCAALASAREGANTALINDRAVLGGNASTEIRIPCSGAGEHNPCAMETGLILELLLEERVGSFERPGEGMVNARWDTVLYDITRRQQNLGVFLNTSVFEVEMAAPDRMAAAIGLNRRNEKRIRFESKVFIEATGDGLVGALAGVPFRIGQEARSEYGEPMAPQTPGDWTLGCSLYFHARDTGRPADFTPPAWAARYETEESLAGRHHAQIDGGYWWIEIGYPFDTIKQDDEIRDEILRHLYGIWDHIKNHCTNKDKARNFALDWVSMVPGRRESRRFIGSYVLTENDLRARILFDDRIAYGGWIIDDHTKGGILSAGKKPSFDDVTEHACLVAPYSVPLSSLHTPKVRNLLFAGRVMSASRLAFNSLRVMRTLAVIGQAAGTAAAHAVRESRLPVHFSGSDVCAVQQSLLRQDCYIPFVWNEDPDDLARTAEVSASSQAPLVGEPDGPGLELIQPTAQILPVSTDRLSSVQLYLENRSQRPVRASVSLHLAKDIWDLPALVGNALRGVPPFAESEAEIPSGPANWVAFNVNARIEPRKLYWLSLKAAPGVVWHVNKTVLPGFCVARITDAKWQFAHVRGWRNLAVRVEPEQRPFDPENVNQGAARPEAWPNLWISDPAQPLPQWIELRWPEAQRFRKAQFAFDTDLNRTSWGMPAGFRAPECVKDFSIVAPGFHAGRVNGMRPGCRRWRVRARTRTLQFPPLLDHELRILALHLKRSCINNRRRHDRPLR